MKAEEIEIAHEKEAISISISKEMKAWLSMGDIKPILNTEYLAHKFQGGWVSNTFLASCTTACGVTI